MHYSYESMNWLEKQVKEIPQELFIQESNQAYSYLDVAEMVHAYSQALLREGIKPFDHILIYLPGGVELAEVILACFEIGAIAVPISTKITGYECKNITDEILPRVIITNWKMMNSFADYSYPRINIEELLNSSGGCGLLKNEYVKNNEDVCAIILTSGTTGLPKGVRLTYQNFESSCNNWNETNCGDAV